MSNNNHNLPTEINITARKDFELSERTMDSLADDVNEYLSEKYGVLNGGWSFEIKISDILWEE